MFSLPRNFFTERYCIDPPAAPYGGFSTWNSSLTGKTPYLTKVEYTCGPGKKLMKIENGQEVYYDKKTVSCMWNQTYTGNLLQVRIFSLDGAMSSLHMNLRWIRASLSSAWTSRCRRATTSNTSPTAFPSISTPT